MSHDPAAWQQSSKAGHELDLWLEQQAPKLNTGRELEALRQVKTAYDDYIAAARQLISAIRRIAPGGCTGRVQQFPRAIPALVRPGPGAGRAHYESRDQVLARANATLGQLRVSVLTLVALLFLCGVALAVLAYRDLIIPLRVKLVESQSLAERHEKTGIAGIAGGGRGA